MTVVAAVDYGRRRIGLAISDPMGITARGLETVEGGPTPEAAAGRVAEALAALQPDRIVIGLPLHESGDESEISREARSFGAALGNTLPAEVVFHDETLTSWEAEQALKARGMDLREARRSGLIDQEAARGLLLAYLRENG
ncbi:MAG: Holliday junction resolvase RuvX [Planctomycetota bacterium]|nr:Holliday junction resolvase RuvX [Planctomycetota bacterium]